MPDTDPAQAGAVRFVPGGTHPVGYRRTGALLDGLGLESACLTGLSMGGSTAISFAGRYPGRADALVLADTTAWYGPDAPRTWAERADGVLGRPREHQVPFQVERWFTERFRQRHPGEVNRVVGIFLRTGSLAQ
jgi:3-oxoadipate enol-lactonase